jgi:hypothetical protein
MRVVLDGPLTYERYLRLQESMKTPLQQTAPLLLALDRRRTEADPTWLLIRRGMGDTDEDLMNALAQKAVPPTALATRLVRDAVRATGRAGTGDQDTHEPALLPEHGRLLFGPAVQYMMRYGSRGRAEFRQLGYLAPALDYYYADDQRAQVKWGTRILRNVYGMRLSKGDIREVLGDSKYPPTDALLVAIIELAPAHAEFAMTEYGRARATDLVPAVRKRRLRSYFPGVPHLDRSRPGHRQRGPLRSAEPQGALPAPFRGDRAKAIVLLVGLVVILAMVVLIYVSHLS